MQFSPEARKQILSQLNNDKHVLVDLSGVSYIDSSGIASLVEGFQLARSRKLRFGLVGVSKAAQQVLQLARLDKVFPIGLDNAVFSSWKKPVTCRACCGTRRCG